MGNGKPGICSRIEYALSTAPPRCTGHQTLEPCGTQKTYLPRFACLNFGQHKVPHQAQITGMDSIDFSLSVH